MALSEVFRAASSHRYDSEYFLKRYLNDEATIRSQVDRFERISSLPIVADASAFYPSIEADYGCGNLPFLRVGDVNGFIELADAITIPEDLCNKYPTLNRVRSGDILFTKGGAIDRVGLVPGEAAVSRDLISLSTSSLSETRQKYLFAYFQTSFFKRALVRSSSQTAQPHLTLGLIRHLPVLRCSKSLEIAVADLIKRAEISERNANASLIEAESDLIDALGFGGWSPHEPLSYTRSAGVVVDAGRLDAAYFAPKYDQIAERLYETGQSLAIGDDERAFVSRGTQPDYAESGLPVVNSKHVRTNRVLLDAGNRLAVASRVRIRRGDVLINGTGVGTIGRVAPYLYEQEAVPDNHVTVVRMEGIDPIFLSVFLNSSIGQQQIERMISGSSGQIELYPADIRRILIWRAPDEIQSRIAARVENAFSLEAESIRLLSAAKRAVEIAIKDGEASALAFVAEQENVNANPA